MRVFYSFVLSFWIFLASTSGIVGLYFSLITGNATAQGVGPTPEIKAIIQSLSPEERANFFLLSRQERRAFINKRLPRRHKPGGAVGIFGKKRQKGFRHFSTNDGGQTWTMNFSPVKSMSTRGGVDPEAFLGLDGKVWIYYFGSNNTKGDPARNQPDDTWRILLAKSNDQGATFVEKGISYQERRGLTDPFVLQLRNGSYRMYISRGASVFSAFSNDGKEFTVENGTRVKDGKGGVPGALLLEDGSTIIFVCGRAGIYSSISKDGLEFDDFELVLEAPNGKMICDPSPEKIGKGSYVMAYKEKPKDVRGPRQDYVKIATSKDGLEWQKREGVVGSGSVPSLLVLGERHWKIYVSGPPPHMGPKPH